MSGPRYWREIPQRYRLEAAKCRKCGKISFPPRQICPSCRSRVFDDVKINDTGEIETYTIIRVPPTQFSEEAPYAVAIVNLGDGVRILSQVADCAPEDMKIGMPVRMEFRKIQEEGPGGILCYGYKCVPA